MGGSIAPAAVYLLVFGHDYRAEAVARVPLPPVKQFKHASADPIDVSNTIGRALTSSPPASGQRRDTVPVRPATSSPRPACSSPCTVRSAGRRLRGGRRVRRLQRLLLLLQSFITLEWQWFGLGVLLLAQRRPASFCHRVASSRALPDARAADAAARGAGRGVQKA